MHLSSKMTGKVLHFALAYMISVQSLLSALPGSSAWCQLAGITVMTKDSHPQRQITRVFKNISYPASKKKKMKHIFIKRYFYLWPQLLWQMCSYMLHKELLFHLEVNTQCCSDNTNFSKWSNMLDSVEEQDYNLPFQTSALEVTNGKH